MLRARLRLQTVSFDGDIPLMPTFVILGVLALDIGFLLFGVTPYGCCRVGEGSG